MFSNYRNETVMTLDGNLYLLQYGSYISREVMEENTKKLDDFLMMEIDNKYYVYLAATTDLLIAKNLQKYFENNNLYTYIKNDFISDSNIINQIKSEEKKLEDEISSQIIKNILEILKKAK